MNQIGGVASADAATVITHASPLNIKKQIEIMDQEKELEYLNKYIIWQKKIRMYFIHISVIVKHILNSSHSKQWNFNVVELQFWHGYDPNILMN